MCPRGTISTMQLRCRCSRMNCQVGRLPSRAFPAPTHQRRGFSCANVKCLWPIQRHESEMSSMLLPTGNRRVAVVVPCLNESEPIGGVVREILSEGVDDVIVVDNGSAGRPAPPAAAAGATEVRHPRPAPRGPRAPRVSSLPPHPQHPYL